MKYSFMECEGYHGVYFVSVKRDGKLFEAMVLRHGKVHLREIDEYWYERPSDDHRSEEYRTISNDILEDVDTVKSLIENDDSFDKDSVEIRMMAFVPQYRFFIVIDNGLLVKFDYKVKPNYNSKLSSDKYIIKYEMHMEDTDYWKIEKKIGKDHIYDFRKYVYDGDRITDEGLEFINAFSFFLCRLCASEVVNADKK
jgi:hypothetical protein